MDILDLTIKDALDIASMVNGASVSKQDAVCEYPLAIVVADRGFVYIGRVIVLDSWVNVYEASNIRYWGTERGLGQLAIEGPTSKTQVDVIGSVQIPIRAVISIVSVSESARREWALKLIS